MSSLLLTALPATSSAEPHPEGSPKVAIIVQARMTSTRLPGKVLQVVAGRPLLAHQLLRLRRVRTPHIIVVATTANASDDPVARLASSMGCIVFRGSEDDVLDRYMGAASAVHAEIVVRATADCPLIDPEVVDRVLGRFLDGDCDYASNTMRRTFPRGMDVEAFSRQVLDVAAAEATDPWEREHVTPFVYRRPARFRLASVESPVDLSAHRLTVDTPEDLELIARVMGAFASDVASVRLNDVVDVLERHPEWTALNRGVVQRSVAPDSADA